MGLVHLFRISLITLALRKPGSRNYVSLTVEVILIDTRLSRRDPWKLGCQEYSNMIFMIGEGQQKENRRNSCCIRVAMGHFAQNLK